MKRLNFILAIFYISLFSVYAQRVEKVKAFYAYFPPETVSLDVAKETALKRAKIQAIADCFGSIITESNSTIVKNVNGQSSVDFLSLGESEVKGEWIETIEEPRYVIRYEQNMLVVEVSVKGLIREIVSAPIIFDVKILRNGTDDRFEETSFRDGDDLYMSFKCPVDGYLAVYLMDDNNNAFCILPYQSQTSGVYKVKANQHYVLFSEKDAISTSEASEVDEYTLTANKELERNQIYIIFSTNPFSKAADIKTEETLPRQLSYTQFQKWLASCRKYDCRMCVQKEIITISKNN